MSSFDDDLFRDSAERLSALSTALSQDALQGVAREVVSRLAARRHTPGLIEDRNHPAPEVIEDLTTALVSEDPTRAREMMRRFQREGVALDVLYARYLAPAAARLGELWDTDRLSFSRVTIGAGRIYDIVRLLRDALPLPRITRAEPVLFATVPGEKHSVGLRMAVELFRQNGWDVHMMAGASHDEILAALGDTRFLVLGLASGGRATFEALTKLVRAVQVAYPEIYILVSGRVVTEDPELISLLAPDGAVATVEAALNTIEALAARPA
jgi:methanogenic corrinoid protein MtbC1